MKIIIHKTFKALILQHLTDLIPIAILSPCLIIALPLAAQTPSSQTSKAANQNTNQNINQNTNQNTNQNIIYVNPLTGLDRPDRGSNTLPFKTITYALSRAQSEQIVQLTNGTYSIASGEEFPIRLPSTLTLRGDEANKGKGITIYGGGMLLTGSGFPQNVAIALGDRSELRGVTLTNPNSRGYGLWIENASPTVSNSTFLGNQQDGALITGKSAAIVSFNQFFRNGTSGLAIEGQASPDIRSNLFQQTTFGMSIRQEATPQITENTFTQNQNGILIQANAKPVLRGNAIVNNRNYGLTISDLAKPDLGKANDDGNNTLQGNGTLDLQNVSRNAVVVIGNQLDIKRVKGNLQLLNVRPPSNLFVNNFVNSSVANAASANPSTIPSNPKSDRFANLKLEQEISASQPMNLASHLDSPPALVRPTASNPNNSFNFANTQGNQANQANQANNPFWYEPVTSVIIRIAPRGLDSPIPANTEITSSLRPVRSFPPSGEPVNQPIQIAPLANTSLTPQTPPRYRVVVPVSSANAVAQVRQIVPNSFASRLNGYLVVQIGAYSDRRIAEVQVSRLAQQGLSARIETINP